MRSVSLNGRIQFLFAAGSSSDLVVLYEILVTDEYGLIGDLGSPQFIIDGGANIGLASLLLLNLYQDARVIAVEPDTRTAEMCRKNLASYYTRATVLQGAIWSRIGKLCFQPSDQEYMASVRDAREGEEASVEAFTMPSIIALGDGRAVDLLKIDVEGGEREIFAPGSLEWLPKKHRDRVAWPRLRRAFLFGYQTL